MWSRQKASGSRVRCLNCRKGLGLYKRSSAKHYVWASCWQSPALASGHFGSQSEASNFPHALHREFRLLHGLLVTI